MASISDLQTSVKEFREELATSMDDFISITSQRLSYFSSDVDDARTSELSYIDNKLAEITQRLDEYRKELSDNKLDLQFPLETDAFNTAIPLSTLEKYAPEYKDITTDVNDIVSTLLPLINLPTSVSDIKDLIKKQSYTTAYLSCFDSIVDSCSKYSSSIGSPSELFNSILYLENERNLYLVRLAMMQEDAKVGAKGFRKPTSINVFARTELVDKYNRQLADKYKDAIGKINTQIAGLYNKAIDILLTKEAFSINMSNKLLDSLIDASKLNTDFEVENIKIAFLQYSSEADAAIKQLNAGLTAIKTKEEAFIKSAQLLFKAQSEMALKSFDAIKKKVEADILLAIKDSELSTEEVKLYVEGSIKELDFMARRLDYWANVMQQQAEDKSRSIAQANEIYTKTLSTLGSHAVAVSTTKG